MKIARSPRLRLALAATLALGGCAGPSEYHKFPGLWPSAIETAARSTPMPEPSGPFIAVSELAYAGGQEGSGATTADMLTSLFIQRMQQKGMSVGSVVALDSEEDERLECTIDKLFYLIRRGYPRSVLYEAELSCVLRSPGIEVPRWRQHLVQRYETQALLNTMNKLSHPYEQNLLRECVLPLLDAMAVSLKTFLDHAPAVRRTHSQ